MNAQPKSILTSAILWISGIVVGWLVTKGLAPAADQSVLTNDVAGALVMGFGALMTWYKERQHTPDALAVAVAKSDPVVLAKAVNATDQTTIIKVVNEANNGVKVVPSSSPTDPINRPLTGVK